MSYWLLKLFPVETGQASDFHLPESVTVDTMLQHRRQREQKERLKRLEPAKRRGSLLQSEVVRCDGIKTTQKHLLQ